MFRRTLVTAMTAIAVGGVTAGSASAAAVPLCVPSAAGANVTTPLAGGTCPGGTTKRDLVEQADLDAAKARITTLETRFAGSSRVTVNGQPTLRFSGVNIQLINGSGSTSTNNGRGNLILGYNEEPRSQSGSHNLALGNNQGFTSWGSLVGGVHNTSSSFGQAVFGGYSRATAPYANVLGGWRNFASSRLSTILGGCQNVTGSAAYTTDDFCFTDNGESQTIGGGAYNRAQGTASTATAGLQNTAVGAWSAIHGGGQNTVNRSRLRDPRRQSQQHLHRPVRRRVVLGDRLGLQQLGQRANWSSVMGGAGNAVAGQHAQVVGGRFNTADGYGSSILGGGGKVIPAGSPNDTSIPATP